MRVQLDVEDAFINVFTDCLFLQWVLVFYSSSELKSRFLSFFLIIVCFLVFLVILRLTTVS